MGGAPTGIYYGFSLYSESVKAQLQLTNGQMLNIAVAPAVMSFFGPAFGSFAQRLGPQKSFAAGGAILVITQLVIYIIAKCKMPHAAITLPLVNSMTMVGTSLITAFYATLPTKHYQHRRGEATALVKSFVGLSGAAVAQLY